MTKKSATKTTPKNAPAAAAPVPEAAAIEKLTKLQLIDQVAQRSSLTKREAGLAVEAAMDAIVEALKAGKSVGLPGLGTLDVRATSARTGVRPGTAEKIQIPAGRKVGFKVAADLKKGL